MKEKSLIESFTVREDKLMQQVKEKNLTLPEKLVDWRLWIQDSQIYLNELKNYIEKYG